MAADKRDLPPLEFRCMKVLWMLGEASVHEVHAQLFRERPLAYTTILTVMDRLARKGLVTRKKEGRAHRYRARLTELQAREAAISRLTEKFFQGSREGLALHLRGAQSDSVAPPGAEASRPRPPAAKPSDSATELGEIEPSLL